MALGQRAFQTDQAGVTLEPYSGQWLETHRQVRNTTHADYKKLLSQWILPYSETLDLGDVTRENVRSLVTDLLGNTARRNYTHAQEWREPACQYVG